MLAADGVYCFDCGPVTLSFNDTKKDLLHLGHLPKKSLGQNFLVDSNIVRKQIEFAELSPGELVVEVGPGLGTLTEACLSAGVNLYAVEFDKVLAKHLEAKFGNVYQERFHLCRADAVAKPLGDLTDNLQESQSFKIVANLPYAISTPWMAGVLDQRVLPTRMVLMLQKETAERFVAREILSQMGPISIFLQSAFDKKLLYPVNRKVFHPVPKVDSCLLVLDRKAQVYRFVDFTRQIIQKFFTQRRKQIAHLMRHAEEGAEAFDSWKIDLEKRQLPITLRPEAIPIEAWQLLDQCVRSVFNIKE